MASSKLIVGLATAAVLFTVARGQTVSVEGDPCHPLVTGEGDGAKTVGTVCAKVEFGTISFEVNTRDPYVLQETHICNLPYTSPGDLHAPSYTIEIPEEDAIEIVCGFDETEYLVAGHASTYDSTIRGAETFTSYFQIPMACSDVLLPGSPEFSVATPPDSECETVFGYIQNNNYCFPNRLQNEEENCATCFQHMTKVVGDDEKYPEFHQWGWVLGGFERVNDFYRMTNRPQRNYNGELWAHSHDCDNRVGEKVGSFEIDMRTKRGKVIVELEAYDGWVFKETHIHVSNKKNAGYMPLDEYGMRTVIPRYYSNHHELINGGLGAQLDRHEIQSKGTAYFIIHAVACLAN